MANKNNPNPNNVKRSEVDDVFRAQVTEPLRKKKGYLSRHQAERDRDLKIAQEIVDKANKKKKK